MRNQAFDRLCACETIKLSTLELTATLFHGVIITAVMYVLVLTAWVLAGLLGG